MKKYKNIPQLRFPEFEEEWKIVKLRTISETITKGTTPRKFVDSGINFVKIECFNGSFIDPAKCLFIDDDIHNGELKRSILKEGDILFAIAGATIGKCNIVPKEILPANTNQALSIIRLYPKENRLYIYYNLTSDRMEKYIRDNIAVGAQPNLNLQQIGDFPAPYPSPFEQQKIASFFTAIDQKISQLKRKKTLLEQYKKWVMQKIFSQQIRFKDDKGQEFPKWENMKLGKVIGILKGEQLNKTELQKFGNYPCLNGGIEPSGYTDKFNTEEDTVTISEGGNSCGYINFMKTKFWCGGHCYKVITNGLNALYLFQLLKQNERRIMALRVGSGLPNIQKKDIHRYTLSITISSQEQTKIANFLSAIDDKITHTQNQIEKAEVWKKGLMQQMFV